MNRIQNLSIKNKLIVIILAITMFVVSLGSILLLVRDIQSMKSALVNNTLVSSRLLGEYCIVPLTFEDVNSLPDILSTLQSITDIENGYVYDPENVLLASYDKTSFNDPPDLTGLKDNYFFQDSKLVVYHEIVFNNSKLGSIVLVASTSGLKNKIKTSLLALCGILFGLLLVSYFLARKLQAVISQPILDLAAVTKEISRSGDYSLHIQKHADDEIGELYDDFNDMLKQIQLRDTAVRESEEKLRTFVTNAQAIILMLDKEGVILLSEGKELASIGLKPGQVVGNSIFDLYNNYHEITESTNDALHGIATKKIISLENVTFEMYFAPYKDSRGEVIGAFSMATNINERILAFEEREKLEKQLFQSQKMETVGRLAGGVAHDFNNLLTVITGNAELALSGMKKNDELYDDITEIKNTADRAAQLTRQLLTFSRRHVINPSIINLNTVLMNMDKMMRRLIGENIEYVTLPYQDLWLVEVDQGQIEQVLTNLVVNAHDAMLDGGKLTIETENIILDEHSNANLSPGEYVMVAVSDSGIGIQQDDLAKVFEPFFTTKEMGKGTGLGLSTSYGIVKESAGDIWIYSEPGIGTSVKIYLPKVVGTVERENQTIDTSMLPFGNETILVVEDEPLLRKMMIRILDGQGYKILEAAHGEEALRIFNESKTSIHLVVTDVIMPHMGGKQLYDNIKTTNSVTKILFMSGYTDQSIALHGDLDSDAFFIQKPFTPVAILRKVREILDI